MSSNSTITPEQIIAAANFRIQPATFTAMIFTFLALSIVVAIARVYMRVVAFGKLNIDDYFMMAAVVSFAASVGVTQWSRELLYLQMAFAVSTADVATVEFDISSMLSLGGLDTAQYILEWVAIYCVKFSYLFFFRGLVKRLRPLEIWWKILVALTMAIALPTIFLSFYVCPAYDESFMDKCLKTGDVYIREQTLLTISTATDIATDILIISIPLALLTQVRLEFKRKLALGAVLCLSVVMIIIASIRFGLCQIQGQQRAVPDSIWLFFWQSVECFVAISMVSLTAFRSLYGQVKKSRAGQYINVAESDDKNTKSPSRAITKLVNIHVTSEAREEEMVNLEKPSAARMNSRIASASSSWDSMV